MRKYHLNAEDRRGMNDLMRALDSACNPVLPVRISVGGPAYGFPCAAYADADHPAFTSTTVAVAGVGNTPEEAAEDARRLVNTMGEREGFQPEFLYDTEN